SRARRERRPDQPYSTARAILKIEATIRAALARLHFPATARTTRRDRQSSRREPAEMDGRPGRVRSPQRANQCRRAELCLESCSTTFAKSPRAQSPGFARYRPRCPLPARADRPAQPAHASAGAKCGWKDRTIATPSAESIRATAERKNQSSRSSLVILA